MREGTNEEAREFQHMPVADGSASHGNRDLLLLRLLIPPTTSPPPNLPLHDAAMNQDAPNEIRYVRYDGARENEYVAGMRQLIAKDLSEPYSIYVYRYFLYQWGDLCFLAMDEKDEMIGVVISKLEPHRSGPLRGYIAMLAVNEGYRGRGIATKLVQMAIDAMIERDADEVSCFQFRLFLSC